MFKNRELKPKNIDRKYYIFAFKIIGDFGATIAVPVVISAIIGQKLDDIWGIRPVMLTIFMTISATLSGYMIYKKSKVYGQQFQDLDKKQ